MHPEQKIAVCDLGTNIWRIRIVNTKHCITNTAPHEILKAILKDSISLRYSVFMAQDGTAFVSETAMERCQEALMGFKELITNSQVQRVWVAATAGFRQTGNAQTIVDWAAQQLGLQIEIISGDREAELLGNGIRAAIQPVFDIGENVLLMDIGGGSIEYIISNADRTLWAKSYPIGVSAMYEKWHNTDPISPTQQTNILAFLETVLADLPKVLALHKVKKLAIAAGTFSVLYSLLGVLRDPDHSFNVLSRADFEQLYAELMPQKLSELAANPLIPSHRVQLLQISLFPILHAAQLINVDEIIVPRWSLEEGMILEMLEH